LGGETPPIISSKKYVGSVSLPVGFNLPPEKLSIESGIAGLTSISSEGLFKAEMNCEITTLLTVLDSNGRSYLMKLFPKSDDIKEQNPVINSKSTAVALIAMQAGIITSEPNIDAIILQFINNLPETQIVADRIDYELKNGLLSLNGSLSADLLKKCINANQALNNLTLPNSIAFNSIKKIKYNLVKAYGMIVPDAFADWPGLSCTDQNTDTFFDIDGVDKDGVCLSGTVRQPGQESGFPMENRAGRWAVLGLNDQNNFTLIDWVEPRSISLPTIDDLLQEIFKLSLEEAIDFLNKIFNEQEDTQSFVDRLENVVSSYYGNGSSLGKYSFPNAGLYTLTIAGAKLNAFSSGLPNDIEFEVFQSFVMSTMTEVIGPWISVVAEFKKADINDSIKYSISKDNCRQQLIDFMTPSIPQLISIYTKTVDEDLPLALKEFTKDFLLNNFISADGASPGVMLTACMFKRLFSWQQIRAKAINKIRNYLGTGGIGAYVDAINKGISVANASVSTILFLKTICDSNIEPTDSYQVKVGGSTCGAYVAPGVWKEFDCYNLAAIGKTTSDDPFTPSWRLNGGYWQWGRKGPDPSQWYTANTPNFAHGPTGPGAGEANSGVINGWDTSSAPNGAWSETSKTTNDPCPAGFRVPTSVQWGGVSVNNTQSAVGTLSTSWLDDTNYSSARFFGNRLMLPAAGYRDNYYYNGLLVDRGYRGIYWATGDEYGDMAEYMVFYGSKYGTGGSYRKMGFSVRCIKE
jgi:uncharacterized protein (TIGR02145 family)